MTKVEAKFVVERLREIRHKADGDNKLVIEYMVDKLISDLDSLSS